MTPIPISNRPRSWLPLPLLAAFALGVGPRALAAQDPPRPLGAEVSVQGMVFDNFFRTSNEGAIRQIEALQVDGSLVAALNSTGRQTLSVGGSFVSYASLGQSPGVNLRLQSVGRVHAFDLRGAYQWDRPAFEGLDFVETADIVRVFGRYSFRPTSTLWFNAEGLLADLTFRQFPANDGAVGRVGGSLQFRGLGYRLSPEVGGSYGLRATTSGDADFEERAAFARIILVPFRGVWTSVRYRYRVRDFSVIDAADPNFGRKDEHGQWTVTTAIDVAPSTTLNVYYAFLDADSDRTVRVFTSQTLILGLTWKY